MAKSDNKMQPTAVKPQEFIDQVENDVRRQDAETLVEMMREITGHDPVIWGPSIIGFDSYHYVYASGREGDAPAAGFSPRKAETVVYLMGGYEELYPEQLAKLGPYRTGNACLYIKRLDKVDQDILRWMIRDSYDRIKNEYPD